MDHRRSEISTMVMRIHPSLTVPCDAPAKPKFVVPVAERPINSNKCQPGGSLRVTWVKAIDPVPLATCVPCCPNPFVLPSLVPSSRTSTKELSPTLFSPHVNPTMMANWPPREYARLVNRLPVIPVWVIESIVMKDVDEVTYVPSDS